MLAMAVMEVMAEKVTKMPVVLVTLMTLFCAYHVDVNLALFFFNQLRLGASYLSPLYLGFHTVNWSACLGNLPPQL